MTLTVRNRLAAAALSLAAVLPGCGGSDAPATPTPSPTPTPTPAPQVISYQPVWELPSGFYIADDFTIPSPGTLTATVDWQSSNNNVDVYITKHPCTPADFFAGNRRCRIYDKDKKPSAKPAVVRFVAEQNHVGAARIFIVNKGPGAEKGSFLIELQRAP